MAGSKSGKYEIVRKLLIVVSVEQIGEESDMVARFQAGEEVELPISDETRKHLREEYEKRSRMDNPPRNPCL